MKPRSYRTNVAAAFLERWKKLNTARYRSTTLATVKETPYTLGNLLWSLLSLRKFWAAQKIASGKKVQFSAAAKFTAAITTLSQSSWTHGSARPTQISWTLDHRCFARAVIKRCTTFGRAVVSVLRADTELKELCRALKKRSIAVIKRCLALVCLCGTNARFRSLTVTPTL